jgi:nucleoside-diphosphate-sugar epimerase
VRDFLHVDDVASALCRIVDSGLKGDVNICSSSPVEVRTLLETIARVTGRADCLGLGARKARDWAPAFLCGDNGRLRALGWKPRYTLEAGIEATVQWWRERAG